jgi:cysteinyl-tRNA synthetase
MGHLSISGSKMSKSLKNFTTIREALARGDWNARSLRIIFLLGGWHDGIEITDDMRKAGASWESYVTNFFYKVRDLEVHPNISSTGAEDSKIEAAFESAKEKVHNALADSFDTPTAMRAISGLITDYNSADKSGLSDSVSFDVARYITRIIRIFGSMALRTLTTAQSAGPASTSPPTPRSSSTPLRAPATKCASTPSPAICLVPSSKISSRSTSPL